MDSKKFKINILEDKSLVKDVEDYFNRQNRSIEECLIWASEHECSDLYIKVSERPYISRYGKIVELPCSHTSKEDWAIFYDRYVLNELNAKYVREKLLDISIEVRIPENSKNFGKYDSNYYRYRASFGFSGNLNIVTFRMIKPDVPTFGNINYPARCRDALVNAFSNKTGINLITGATGSGKSTTLAACINSFTRPNGILDNKVIITLEDPIENLFKNTNSVKIVQKELDKDFKSFDIGIKAALREHPNIIVVGECRDKPVICAAIDASRTGHLTISSFHSGSVGGTLSRLLYYLDNDLNLSYDLIIQLNIIMSQRLIQQEDKYLVDTQYMIFNDFVKENLLEAVSNKENITIAVEKLLKNSELIENKIVKTWEYSKN